MTFTRSLAILALAFLSSPRPLEAEPACPGGYSNQFRLNGRVQNPARFRLFELTVSSLFNRHCELLLR